VSDDEGNESSETPSLEERTTKSGRLPGDRAYEAVRRFLCGPRLSMRDRAMARAVAFARSISPAVKAVHVTTSEESARQFRKRWDIWAGKVPLVLIESPYRSLVPPLLRYIEALQEREPELPITVVIASFMPHSWWERPH
jgi:hypothetical protein